MSAVLACLQGAGLQLRSSGEQVIVTPRSALTDELREFIRDNKPAILDELTALERRRARVERELVEHPGQRAAIDAADSPLRPEAGKPVSVVVAIRTTAGIVSGELSVPRERFDAVLFFRTLQDTSERPS